MKLDVAFCLDVDNTLIDNDGVKSDLDASIKAVVGPEGDAEFWRIYEDVRAERDVVDYPETLNRFHRVCEDPTLFSRIASLVISYPFERRLYPGALETVRYLHALGRAIILSDGDQLYQRLKIARSGLADAVDHHVLITVHKEQSLETLYDLFPAIRYVMIDDKPRILSDLKRATPDRFTTVQVLQGKYAHDDARTYVPAPDFVVPAIEDVRSITPEQFRTGARSA